MGRCLGFPLFRQHCVEHCRLCPTKRHALIVDQENRFLGLLAQAFPYQRSCAVEIEILVVGDLDHLSYFLDFTTQFLRVSSCRLDRGVLLQNTALFLDNHISREQVLHLLTQKRNTTTPDFLT